MTTATDQFTNLVERTLRNDSRHCSCDFCTGKKHHEDNWCSACAQVQLQPPKWWEDLDMCDACGRTFAIECNSTRQELNEHEHRENDPRRNR
jgi:hypothetical protein